MLACTSSITVRFTSIFDLIALKRSEAAFLYLHRDTIPFIPPDDWTPETGLQNDSALNAIARSRAPAGWWSEMHRRVCEAANIVTDISDRSMAECFIGFKS